MNFILHRANLSYVIFGSGATESWTVYSVKWVSAKYLNGLVTVL